ncbi:Structural maintenance of chromosomes protein 6 [Coemansia sp. RSA 2049]|nr:Structural maintenance of chromosomes protein 6 [Coemansia sp. RSA 2049]
MAKPRLKHALGEDSSAAGNGPTKDKRSRLVQSPMNDYSAEEPAKENSGNGTNEASSTAPVNGQSANGRTNVTRIRGRQAASATQESAAEPDMGVVEMVEIVDFMCHERAVVNLCSKVNFITGQNGSGKSAILTGLIIALGGSASSTNRATNLRGFIRAGQSRAIIRVRLRNRGPDAYKPDAYGDSIVIERQIHGTGSVTSQYKIKNGRTGEVVSKRRDDVASITDYMAIQVNNPINMLSQDAAREFLGNTSPEKLYGFFLKGTQLWQLSEDLKLIRQSITQAETSIERKRSILPEMKAEKRRWEQHYDDMRQARDLSARLTLLGHQMAWAMVKEAEAEVEDVAKDIEAREAKVGKIDENLGKEQEAINEIQAETRTIEQQAEAQLAQLGPLQTEKTVPQAQAAAIKDALRAFRQTESEMDAEARSTRERMDALKTQIATERARLEDTAGQEGAEKTEAAIAQLKEAIERENAKIEDLQTQQRDTETRTNELREARSAADREVHRLRAEEREAKTSLESLKSQTSNRLSAFGKGVPEALGIIERTQWQSSKPVGPLGMHLKLRKREWSNIIETTLDKSLNAFLVTSHADRATLDGIFRRCGCQSRIVVCNQELFDYSAGEPDPKHLTILRALEFTNEVVKRQLITLNRIEQIILVDRRATGDAVMASNNGGFPRNVIACLTLDGYSVGARSGGLASTAIHMGRPTNRLGEDIKQAIVRETRALEEKSRARAAAESEHRKASKEIEEQQRRHQRASEEIRQSKRRISKADADIQDLKDQMNSNRPVRIAALQSELEALTAQMESIAVQFRDHHSQQRLKEEELEEVDGSIALIEDKIAAVRDGAERLQRDAENMATKCQRHMNNIDYWNAKKAGMRERIQQLETQRRELAAKAGETEADARKVSAARVESEHTPAELDRMLSGCRARLEEIERSSSMSLGEVAERAQTYIREYAKAKDDLRTTSRLVALLKTAHQQRLRKWTQFRDSMTVRTKLHFTRHLYQRGYTGKLEFDHSQNTLVPKVQTDQDLVAQRTGTASSQQQQQQQRQDGGGAGYQRKDTKSLSGGEKSFTTICLLLSLWETMNCPVRALDEFDVFMDAAFRKITMRMMVDSARLKGDTQFILITPQDMSVKPDADIAIFRLQPPRRSANTANAGAGAGADGDGDASSATAT